MYHTNKCKRIASALLVSNLSLFLLRPECIAAETIKLHKRITGQEMRCFQELFRERPLQYSVGELSKFITETEGGRADLKGDGRYEFIFVVHDIGYCGSAGCMMLIGERHHDGTCHLIADAGSDGGEVTVLGRRDHGYRRLYAPCELYFDGRQYQQVHEECPNVDVRH